MGVIKRQGDVVLKRWRHGVVVVGVLVTAFFLGHGIEAHWGAGQWGPYSAWVAGGLTLAAVSVALSESVRTHRIRAIDHELTRRRECLQALAGVWTALTTMSLEFIVFTDYVQNLPERFDPNDPRPDDVPSDHPGQAFAFDIRQRVEEFLTKWTSTVEPPLFMALALLQDTPLDQPIKDVTEAIRQITTDDLPPINRALIAGHRPDITVMNARWAELLRQRRAHLNLARLHFSLELDHVDASLSRRSRR